MLNTINTGFKGTIGIFDNVVFGIMNAFIYIHCVIVTVFCYAVSDLLNAQCQLFSA